MPKDSVPLASFAAFILLAATALAGWSFFDGWRLRTGRKVLSFDRKTVPPGISSSLSRHYGTLMIGLGFYFLLAVYVALKFDLDFRAFTALIVLGNGIHMLVTSILDRKHGVLPKR